MKSGAALPMVILSLGLVAALSVGGSYVTRRFTTSSKQAQLASALEPMLESALVQAVSNIDSTWLADVPVGTSSHRILPVTSGPDGLITDVWVTRVGERTFVAIGEAQTARNPLQINRLMLAAELDSAVAQPIRHGGWTRLP